METNPDAIGRAAGESTVLGPTHESGLDWPLHHGYNSHMRRVTVTELKNKLSQYLRLVKKGETIEVVERSIPIARLERLRTSGDAELSQLVRDGIVTPARRPAPDDLFARPPIPCRGDAVRAVIEQRGDR